MTLFTVAKNLYGDKYCYQSSPHINGDAEVLTILNGDKQITVAVSGLEKSKASSLKIMLRSKVKNAVVELNKK